MTGCGKIYGGCRFCGDIHPVQWVPRVDGNDVLEGYDCIDCDDFVPLEDTLPVEGADA